MRPFRRLLVPALLVGLMPSAAPAPASAGLAASVPSGSGCVAPSWVRGWEAASSDALAAPVPLSQTFRTVLRVVGAGRSLRITLSNRLGAAPATIGAVTVARPDSGPDGGPGSAAVTPGSLHPLTFDAERSVVLPAGGEARSDPLPMRVRAGDDLTVSLYVASATTPPTQHVLAAQTVHATLPLAGDHTGDPSGDAFPIATPVPGVPVAVPQGIPYLSALDLGHTTSSGTVVAFGDSITDGFQGTLAPVVPSPATIDRDGRYPDFLARRLQAAGSRLAVANAGISGNQLLLDASVPIFGPSGLHRLDHDALDVPGVGTLVVLEGINDLGQGDASVAALEAGYRSLVRRAHARGVRVLLGTLTPDRGTLQPGYGAAAEERRLTLNRWIRGQRLADGVVDFDRAVRDPHDHGRLLPAYDGGDHLHLSRAGYRAMAGAVPLDLLRGPGADGPTCH